MGCRVLCCMLFVLPDMDDFSHSSLSSIGDQVEEHKCTILLVAQRCQESRMSPEAGDVVNWASQFVTEIFLMDFFDMLVWSTGKSPSKLCTNHALKFNTVVVFLVQATSKRPGGSHSNTIINAKCKQMTYPDDLPQISVVFIFVNEALSVILRSVHSVVNHTPSHLLKEIILVDDNSDNVELKFNLDQYVNKRYPGLVKIVRNNKREGLIRARIQGWKAATSPIVGFFDAHVEFNIGWVEPALTRIKEDRKRIILPAIDNIKYNTFEVQQYANAAHGYNWGLWCMYIIPPQDWLDKGDESAPIRTPAMIGCSFVVDREYFGEIGLLDPGMEVYGGENIELGMR
ncbi:PREDICTED: polypeptide N-acetylgalactosaminyltransferase 9-like, partial [Tinamus guttatus]|uniref:polypeptide N-acetylgalactosaminyltransferase 9-like n=1 Tax=Tinamus guttatus TaxID=94827 RepID=UPI00052EAE3B